jgi:hypothetical protein
MMIPQITRDLQRFLRYRLTGEQVTAAISRRLRQRERSFLRLIQRAVYRYPRSPYRALLQHAGITFAELSEWVVRDGLETTLGRLYDAGIYVTAEEFKGRRPIRRARLELPVHASDFDNPLIVGHVAASTGGSSGPATAVPLDFRMLMHETTSTHMYLEGFKLRERPVACWRGIPPIVSGIKMQLGYAKLGINVERWFAQNKLSKTPETEASLQFTRAVLASASRYPNPNTSTKTTPSRLLAGWRIGAQPVGRPNSIPTQVPGFGYALPRSTMAWIFRAASSG